MYLLYYIKNKPIVIIIGVVVVIDVVRLCYQAILRNWGRLSVWDWLLKKRVIEQAEWHVLVLNPFIYKFF